MREPMTDRELLCFLVGALFGGFLVAVIALAPWIDSL